jgi:hypothetical protein
MESIVFSATCFAQACHGSDGDHSFLPESLLPVTEAIDSSRREADGVQKAMTGDQGHHAVCRMLELPVALLQELQLPSQGRGRQNLGQGGQLGQERGHALPKSYCLRITPRRASNKRTVSRIG